MTADPIDGIFEAAREAVPTCQICGGAWLQSQTCCRRALAEARADAERYRWLRKHGDTEAVSDGAWRHMLTGDELDAAIDAALSARRTG